MDPFPKACVGGRRDTAIPLFPKLADHLQGESTHSREKPGIILGVFHVLLLYKKLLPLSKKDSFKELNAEDLLNKWAQKLKYSFRKMKTTW